MVLLESEVAFRGAALRSGGLCTTSPNSTLSFRCAKSSCNQSPAVTTLSGQGRHFLFTATTGQIREGISRLKVGKCSHKRRKVLSGKPKLFESKYQQLPWRLSHGTPLTMLELTTFGFNRPMEQPYALSKITCHNMEIGRNTALATRAHSCHKQCYKHATRLLVSRLASAFSSVWLASFC